MKVVNILWEEENKEKEEREEGKEEKEEEKEREKEREKQRERMRLFWESSTESVEPKGAKDSESRSNAG